MFGRVFRRFRRKEKKDQEVIKEPSVNEKEESSSVDEEDKEPLVEVVFSACEDGIAMSNLWQKCQEKKTGEEVTENFSSVEDMLDKEESELEEKLMEKLHLKYRWVNLPGKLERILGSSDQYR